MGIIFIMYTYMGLICVIMYLYNLLLEYVGPEIFLYVHPWTLDNSDLLSDQ